LEKLLHLVKRNSGRLIERRPDLQEEADKSNDEDDCEMHDNEDHSSVQG
jgi:hypothetical protein